MRLRSGFELAVRPEAFGTVNASETELCNGVDAHGAIRFSRDDFWVEVATVWQSYGYTAAQQGVMTKWLLGHTPRKRYATWALDPSATVRLLVPFADILTTTMWVGGSPPFHVPNAHKIAACVDKILKSVVPTAEFATQMAERHTRLNGTELRRVLLAGCDRGR